jgi:hypothetical protein
MAKKQRTAAAEGERTAPADGHGQPAPGPAGDVLRPPAEVLYADELRALAESDSGPRPPGWRLSPRAVRGGKHQCRVVHHPLLPAGQKVPEGRMRGSPRWCPARTLQVLEHPEAGVIVEVDRFLVGDVTARHQARISRIGRP